MLSILKSVAFTRHQCIRMMIMMMRDEGEKKRCPLQNEFTNKF